MRCVYEEVRRGETVAEMKDLLYPVCVWGGVINGKMLLTEVNGSSRQGVPVDSGDK